MILRYNGEIMVCPTDVWRGLNATWKYISSILDVTENHSFSEIKKFVIANSQNKDIIEKKLVSLTSQDVELLVEYSNIPILNRPEYWFSVDEVKYIIDGNEFPVVYVEGERMERSYSEKRIKEKANEILNQNVEENNYVFPEIQKFNIGRGRPKLFFNIDMVDELLRNLTRVSPLKEKLNNSFFKEKYFNVSEQKVDSYLGSFAGLLETEHVKSYITENNRLIVESLKKSDQLKNNLSAIDSLFYNQFKDTLNLIRFTDKENLAIFEYNQLKERIKSIETRELADLNFNKVKKFLNNEFSVVSSVERTNVLIRNLNICYLEENFTNYQEYVEGLENGNIQYSVALENSLQNFINENKFKIEEFVEKKIKDSVEEEIRTILEAFLDDLLYSLLLKEFDSSRNRIRQTLKVRIEQTNKNISIADIETISEWVYQKVREAKKIFKKDKEWCVGKISEDILINLNLYNSLLSKIKENFEYIDSQMQNDDIGIVVLDNFRSIFSIFYYNY